MQTGKTLIPVKKAMIVAAGLGTRLQPLTDSKPKALIEINGTPLLEILIRKLIRQNYRSLIINIHHHGQQIVEFLKIRNNFGIEITISDESEKLLDTGGGILKAAWFFKGVEPFLVHNVDVLSNINLSAMENHHLNSEALVTLAVRNRNSSRYLLFDSDNRLCGWKNVKTGEEIIVHHHEPFTNLAFSGIHIIQPDMLSLIKQSGKFSIIKTYLDLAREFHITCYQHDGDYWLDVGRPENIQEAEKDIPNLFNPL